MKALILILLWFVLFTLSWPLALAVLVLVPIVWMISIPFRLVVWAVEGVMVLVKTGLFLPARLLGHRKAC